ncbi:hypothetical protein [Embleya sp. NPDC001921]
MAQGNLDDWMREVDKKLRDLHTLAASIPAAATAVVWETLTLAADWDDLVGTDPTVDPLGVSYRPDGTVRMRGAIRRVTGSWPVAGTVAATVPVGYEPTAKQRFVGGVPAGAGWWVGEIRSTGEIVPLGWGGGTAGAVGTCIGLDNLTYRL